MTETLKPCHKPWCIGIGQLVDSLVGMVVRCAVCGLSTEAHQLDRDAVDQWQGHKGWTCFHCGEYFSTVGAARDHFGAEPESLAGCQIKAGEERGLLMALRKAETSRDEWAKEALAGREEIEALELQNEAAVSEIQGYKPFRGCQSIRDVFFVYDSMEGRALANEDVLKGVAIMLNSELKGYNSEPWAQRVIAAVPK